MSLMLALLFGLLSLRARKQASPTGSARKPDLRSGRPRARAFRLLPVLALLLGASGLFPAQQAQAQADNVLVSNMGQTIAPGVNAGSIRAVLLQEDSFATGFTTGSAAAGYILSSIDTRLRLIPSNSQYVLSGLKAELWSSNANGTPKSKIVSLTPPTTFVDGPVIQTNRTHTVTFTAPTGTLLARNTTYHLVLYRTDSVLDDAVVTASASEDAGAATGWSIADAYNFILETTPPSGAWRTRPASSRFTGFLRVRGAAAPDHTLSVDADPPCGSSVPGTSMQPTYSLALEPAPAAETETEYRWLADTEGRWLAATASSIYPDTGRSGFVPRQNTFAHWRNTYPGFRGFEFRLTDTPNVTAQCTWTFTEDPAPSQPRPNTGGTGTGGGGGVSTPTPTPTPTTPPADTPPTEQPYSPRCGENDRENLVRFYEATDGDNWDDNTDWESEEPLGDWHGVDTDDEENVVSLRLADNGLSGEIQEELLSCLSELKELALWGNDDLSAVEIPEDLLLAVERAALREIAEMLNLNPEWFDDYEEPFFNFEDWHEGVTTDEDGRVTGLDLPGEIPGSVISQFKKLREIMTTTGGGGCALSPEGSSAFSLFLLTLAVFAALVRRRA